MQYHTIPCNTWILWRHLHAASAPALIWIPPAPNFWASHTIALCNYCNYWNCCTVQLNCSIILLFSLELKSASTEHRINLMLSYEVNAGQLLAKGLLWSGHVPAIQPPDITHWPQHPGMHHHQYQYPVPALRLALAVRNQIGNIDLHTLSAGTFSGNITHWTQ